MIDIYVTHYTGGEHGIGMNELLGDQIARTSAVTREEHRTTVVYYAADEASEKHLLEMLPKNVVAVRNDREGRQDIQPSLRNKILDLMRVSDADFCVLLHNDVRVAQGWLDRLGHDIEYAELECGGYAVVSPRFIPYHYTGTFFTGPFWEALERNPSVLSTEGMREFCRTYGFHVKPSGSPVVCSAWSPPTRDGHQLMMWAARPGTAREMGYCDERYVGSCYDDCDWGIRALTTGIGNYCSQTALVGHIAGLSYGLFEKHKPEPNEEAFVEKWGRALFLELVSGAVWPRLRAWRRQGPLDVADLFWLVCEGLSPDSVIDVGTGRNGVVGLQYWDRLPGRKVAVDIHAIKALPEGWEPVLLDARDLLEKFGPKSFDVVQACDFIEHLPLEDDILTILEQLARKAVLIFTPLAEQDEIPPSPAVETEPDNPYQRHLSGYRYEDLEARGYTTGRQIEENAWRDVAIVAWKTL